MDRNNPTDFDDLYCGSWNTVSQTWVLCWDNSCVERDESDDRICFLSTCFAVCVAVMSKVLEEERDWLV